MYKILYVITNLYKDSLTNNKKLQITNFKTKFYNILKVTYFCEVIDHPFIFINITTCINEKKK